MVNKFPIRCCYCKATVPVNGGQVWRWRGRWYGAHLECQREGKPSVLEIRTSGGTFTQNVRGRCEDAPCCGCCTI